MRNPLSRLCLILFALLPMQPALAQQRVRPGGLSLSGYLATCGPIGTAVMRINDVAASSGNLIILNPSVFNLPRAQQMFWYTHECGHQIFGPSETVADCWSVEQGRIQGWLSTKEFEQLAEVVSRFPGDSAHARGPARVAYLRQCFYR